MSTIYEVTNEHIENLNDLQLTKILSKLIYLEANKYNIDKSTVNCSLEITVPDGGEDASIKWNNGPESTDWFKCRYNLFQCKATNMGPANCKKEIIVDKDSNVKIKPMIENVFENSGCYILFYNQSLNTKQVKARIEKFREALKEAEKQYYKTAQIYIYDANKIAAWVNTYLSAIVEILIYNKIHLPANLLTWDEWNGYSEYRKYKFETDKTIESYITQLRQHFNDGDRKIARVVGLSGLGKTRIAFETFRNDSTLQSTVKNNKVVYIDSSDCENEILPLVIELRRNEISGILIVDNCSIELHKKLVKEVEHQSSKLNLLTLDYNLEKISASYPIIEIKPILTDVIKKIIKQTYTNIPEDDINRIAEFAQGFPQMAVLISEARLNGEDTLGILNDNEIAKKLLWGRDNPDDLKLEVIKACSIFENFGFYEDKSEERDYIADKICDDRITKDNFYKYAQYFIDKGILDKRGRYLAVTPLPLAIRLAAQWWKECNPIKGKNIILGNMPNNMVEFLCNQISKLHFVEEARELTRYLCSNTCPFGQAEVLTTERGGRIFRALSKVDPQSASIAIYNAFKNYSVEELKKITGIERRELVRALENLCFWKETFDNSAIILSMLAAAENEGWANNATGILNQLFHIFLSGTQAEPKQRLNIVKEVLVKNEEEYKILAIELLGSAITTVGFTKMVGSEKQGSRPTSEEWKPTLWKEIFKYWEEALMLLTDIAKEKNNLGEMARKEIVGGFRGLVQYGRIKALDNSLNAIGKELNYDWFELIDSIKNTIKFDSSEIPKDGIDKLNEWLNLYMHDQLKDKLKSIVSLPSWETKKDEEGHYINITEIKCKQFAKECIENIDELYKNLFVVYCGEQRQGYNFGKELGLLCNKPQVFINNSIKCLIENNDPNVAVLAGFLYSLRMKDNDIVTNTLNNIVSNKKLNKYLVTITSMINPEDTDIDRIILLLEDKDNNITSFRYLAYGKCIDNVSLAYLKKLCISLVKYSIEGKFIALDIINSYDNKRHRLKDILVSIILDSEVIKSLGEFSQMDNYYWEENLKKVLKEDDGQKYAIKLYKTVINSLGTYKFDLNKDEKYEKVLKILLENYPKEIWKLIVDKLVKAGEEESWKLKELLRARWLYINDDSTLIELINENNVINEINKNGLQLALIISQIIRKYDYNSGSPRFKRIIRYIIEKYGENNKQILSNIIFHMGPTSWVGSIIPLYEDKIKVLSEYIDYNKINIQKWARENIDMIKEDIKIEKVREEEKAKGIYF